MELTDKDFKIVIINVIFIFRGEKENKHNMKKNRRYKNKQM